MGLKTLKKEIFRLIEEDEEFRYALAGKLGFTEIINRLKEHDRKFNEILERLDRHEEILIRHGEEIKGIREENHRIWQEIREIWRELRKHREILDKHTSMLGSLGNDIGALTEATLSRFIRDDILDEIRLRGEKLTRIKRMYKINDYEIDLYIETERRIILVEVKTRPSIEDVKRLVRIREHLVERTGKDVKSILASLRAKTTLDIVSEARNNNVELITY
ncbi:MAG: hypothetical protein J7K21_07085 [Desulfurococcales archaeon]|nr:hypothetical protein [Desulfurococcales archaeon]